jgi:1-phosphatidylinositol-4-phosphate 5-kinase
MMFDASLGVHDIKHKPNVRVVNTKLASGKSSSWFFFSSDMRFAIKTCTRKSNFRSVLSLVNSIHSAGDEKCVLRILEAYTDHVKNLTLLPKFFGMYTMDVEGYPKLTFLVMNNVFAQFHGDFIYDLKGSTIGRLVPPEEFKEDKRPILKDLNFVSLLLNCLLHNLDSLRA